MSDVLHFFGAQNLCKFLLLCVVCFGVGCATQTAPLSRATLTSATPSQQLNQQRQERLENIDQWSFKGRAAVQRGNEGWSATLHWDQHDDNAYRLRIIAPLGRGTYEVLKHDDQVSLIDPGNNVFKASTPEQLLTQNIGWNLPISDIEYWVRGLTAPGSKPTQLNLDEGGLIKDLAVKGWRVSVLEYKWQDGLAMPRKLFMNYGDMKMRLVIASWNLPDVAP